MLYSSSHGMKSKEPSWAKGEKEAVEVEEEEEDEESPQLETAAAPPKKEMDRNLTQATERTALAERDDESDDEEDFVIVHRGPMLTFFVAVSALTVTSSLLLAAAHAASLYSYASSRSDERSRGAVDVSLRAYGLVFCAAIFCVELEVGSTTRSSVVSRFWSLRGIFYAFVGLLALDNADEDEARTKGNVPAAWREDSFVPYSIYLRATASSLCALGSVYVLLGLCWCKRIKDSRILDYKKHIAEAQVHNAELAQQRHRRQGSRSNNNNETKGGGATNKKKNNNEKNLLMVTKRQESLDDDDADSLKDVL